MRIRIQDINYDLWQIVEDGQTIQQQNDLSSDDQAKDMICGILSKEIFFQFHRLKTTKQIWDALNSAHEEFVAQSDPHIQTFVPCSLDSDACVKKV